MVAPEPLARQGIDRLLGPAGWAVQVAAIPDSGDARAPQRR